MTSFTEDMRAAMLDWDKATPEQRAAANRHVARLARRLERCPACTATLSDSNRPRRVLGVDGAEWYDGCQWCAGDTDYSDA